MAEEEAATLMAIPQELHVSLQVPSPPNSIHPTPNWCLLPPPPPPRLWQGSMKSLHLALQSLPVSKGDGLGCLQLLGLVRSDRLTTPHGRRNSIRCRLLSVKWNSCALNVNGHAAVLNICLKIKVCTLTIVGCLLSIPQMAARISA